MNQFISEAIFWAVFFFVIRRIFIKKRTLASNPLVIILVVLLVSCFIPLIEISGERWSVVRFMLNGSLSMSIMFFGYLISLLLLLKRDPNLDLLSAITYLVSYIFGWVGILLHIPDEAVNANFGILWWIVYLLAPMPPMLFYLALIMSPSSEGKKRVGIVKMLDDWGTSRPLLRSVAKSLNLNLSENSGWKQAEAEGLIDGLKVKIYDEFMYVRWHGSMQVTRVMVSLKRDNKLSEGLILRKAKRFWVNPVEFDQLDKYTRLLKIPIGNLELYAGSKDELEYKNLLSKHARDLEAILNKDKHVHPAWIIIDKDSILYTKPYPWNFSPGLSTSELEGIIRTSVKIADRLS